MYRYFAIFKPYGMLSQFTGEAGQATLKDLNLDFEKDVYPVGRLDSDSEGLLLLTNDKRVNSRLLEPSAKHVRKYLIQVEGEFSAEAAKQLEKGITINEKGKIYTTLPAIVQVKDSINIPDRTPPVRFRKSIPTSWIEIEIVEGKNRQVRRMTAATGFPTLRLIRTEIEKIRLEKMEIGWLKEFNKSDFYSGLRIKL